MFNMFIKARNLPKGGVMNLNKISFFLVFINIAGCQTARKVDSYDEINKRISGLEVSVNRTSNQVNSITNSIESISEGSGKSPPPVNITPFSKYSDDWGSSEKDAQGQYFSGAYTKLVILSSVDGNIEPNSEKGKNEVDILPYKKRSFFKKLFSDSDYSINLTAKVVVGDFEATIPLVTIGHSSKLTEGDQFTRVIQHTKSDFPLFLVKKDASNAIPNVTLSVNGTKSFTSRGAASAIQVALNIAKATSQSASVITNLSSQSIKDKASAVDNAISKLFSSGIKEEHLTDRDLRFWSVYESSQRPKGVTVKFKIPKNESDWASDKNGNDLLPVGTWIVTFDFPRPSIFSDTRICGEKITLPQCKSTPEEARKIVKSEIEDASTVLNFPLSSFNNEMGTIKAYITQQDWYISALSELAKLASTNPKHIPIVNNLCRKIKNNIVGIGLNGFDASIVAKSVIKGMPVPYGIDDKAFDFNGPNFESCQILVFPPTSSKKIESSNNEM